MIFNYEKLVEADEDTTNVEKDMLLAHKDVFIVINLIPFLTLILLPTNIKITKK